MNIILASASPRRTQILTQANIPHIVIPSNEEEKLDQNLTYIEIVKSLSYQKAKSVFKNHQEDLIIGADTIVVINNEILGKPKDEPEAIKMLQKLSDKTHEVITSVTLIKQDKEQTFIDISKVTFNKLSIDEIKEYIKNEYVYDKAGSYAIQSPHTTFIKQVEGDYNNIVGLPINLLKHHLKEF